MVSKKNGLPPNSSYTTIDYISSNCPECSAEFEIDDRLECIFVNPINLKLPVNGFVCRSCGLVQGYENRKCAFCGVELGTAVQ